LNAYKLKHTGFLWIKLSDYFPKFVRLILHHYYTYLFVLIIAFKMLTIYKTDGKSKLLLK